MKKIKETIDSIKLILKTIIVIMLILLILYFVSNVLSSINKTITYNNDSKEYFTKLESIKEYDMKIHKLEFIVDPNSYPGIDLYMNIDFDNKTVKYISEYSVTSQMLKSGEFERHLNITNIEFSDKDFNVLHRILNNITSNENKYVKNNMSYAGRNEYYKITYNDKIAYIYDGEDFKSLNNIYSIAEPYKNKLVTPRISYNEDIPGIPLVLTTIGRALIEISIFTVPLSIIIIIILCIKKYKNKEYKIKNKVIICLTIIGLPLFVYLNDVILHIF